MANIFLDTLLQLDTESVFASLKNEYPFSLHCWSDVFS